MIYNLEMGKVKLNMKSDPACQNTDLKNHTHPNHLICEKSPYLLQHAFHPVDWHPWGEEAFALARLEDKPIFLSIGYSTCHWCHVMAHESFEDDDVAKLLNQTFICIKVDREERPDIDQMYMMAAQAMTGRGGWPLSIVMTQDKKPFFAATYIPKKGRFGQAGMLEIIPRIRDMWDNHREEALASADKILDYLKGMQGNQIQRTQEQDGSPLTASIPDEKALHDLLRSGYETLSSIYDPKNGGFGSAPKFPAPHNLLFLLRYWKRSGTGHALQMAEETLTAMRNGGIYDHIGFGFHRYSTDAEWFAPHFEKMLYDQALMAIAYTEAYQATGEKLYAKAAREILDYVCRDMADQKGGFYSAEDADSEGVEGKFYTWRAEELRETLNGDDFRLLINVFDVYENGNFEAGQNILRKFASLADVAAVMKIDEKELSVRLEAIRSRLFSVREKRVHPQKDDKILTDWNGLMIASLAKAAQALEEPLYAQAAGKAADFVLREMQADSSRGKRLLHRYRGQAGISAQLDDYAFFVWGLINLYEAAYDVKYLKEALRLCSIMMSSFKDAESGGLFFSAHDANDLPFRRIDYYDGAIPSGNSIALLCLLSLAQLTGDIDWEEKAWDLARAFYLAAGTNPSGYSMMLCSLDLALGPTTLVALVEGREEKREYQYGEETARMLQAIRSRFWPNCVSLVVNGEEIKRIAPFTQDMQPLNERTTAYVCTGHVCRLPVTSLVDLLAILNKL